MKLYPAIDLKDGHCVRLLRGDMTTATSFNDDPADQARRFSDMGFDRLHVVDLNGAFEGVSVNHNAVSAILDAMPAPVQLGGGIRDMMGIERWLDAGVTRVILGTIAVRDPALVREACSTIRKVADARQHDAVRTPDPVGVVGKVRLQLHARAGRGAFQRTGDRTDIARSVVDDCKAGHELEIARPQGRVIGAGARDCPWSTLPGPSAACPAPPPSAAPAPAT